MKLRISWVAFIVGFAVITLVPRVAADTIDFTGSAGRISSQPIVNGVDYTILIPPSANPLYFDGKIGMVNALAVSSGDLSFALTGPASAAFSGLTYTAMFGAGGSLSITGQVSGVSGMNLASGNIVDGTFQVICDDSNCSGGTGTITVDLSPVGINPTLLSLLGVSAPTSGSISEDLLKVKLNGTISEGCFTTPGANSGTNCSFHSTSMTSSVVFTTTPVPEPTSLPLLSTGLSGLAVIGLLRHRRFEY